MSWTDVSKLKWKEYIVYYLDDEDLEWVFESPCETYEEAVELEKKAQQKYKDTRVIEKITTFAVV